MSPARSRDAAWLMAAAEPMLPCDTALAIGFGRDADDADGVDVAAVLAEDGGAMVAPVDAGELGAGDHAALVLREILVREAPRTLDVDDADVAAPSAGLRPRPARIDAAGRCDRERSAARSSPALPAAALRARRPCR